MNLADALAHHVRARPDRAALVHGPRAILYRDLDGLVRRWAATLRAAGIGARQILGVALKDTPEHIVALYAAARLGAIALGQLASAAAVANSSAPLPRPHFTPRAKNVIFLFMDGGPSQMDLYDYKPTLKEWYDKDLPDSVRMNQRLSTMTSGQSRFPVAPSRFAFFNSSIARSIDPVTRSAYRMARPLR